MANLVTNIQGYSIHDGPGIRTVVFLKGCGLECRWCSNPECISPLPEVGFIKKLCTKCGKCADVCPEKALSYEQDKFPRINRERCTGCGACSTACAYDAFVVYGKTMSPGDIFDAVSRDKMFYEGSGGGVTVSGGEALLKPQLVTELFQLCRGAGINTCIETSGFAPESALIKVLQFADYLLYDLKLINSDKHEKHTGKPNDLILSNARIAAKSNAEVLFRMPLIPGVNDDRLNIKETADFLHSLDKKAQRIELMPFHRLGQGKYDSLDRQYHMADLAAAAPERVEAVEAAFRDYGITCSVSR